MKRFAFLLTIMALMTACGEKAPKEPVLEKHDIAIVDGHFTPEIMHQLGKISDLQVSPDGSQILYGVSYTSIEENRSNRNLFVMNIDGSNNRQLTHSPKSINNARWIEGGKRIAFLKGGQMYVMNADGTGERQVSDVPGGMSEFKIHPKGDYVMYVSDFKVARQPADIYPDLSKSTARTIEGLMYRHWDHFVENIPHTYYAKFDGKTLGAGVDILEGAPFELPTEPFGGLEQLDFNPTGNQLVYSCRKLTGRDYAFSTNTDIYVYNMDEQPGVGHPQYNASAGMMGYDTEPVWSPDGTTIAWLSMERDGYEADKVRLFISPIVSGERIELSKDFKYNVGSPVWSPDSKEIYFSAEVEGVKEIWKTDLQGHFTRVTPQHEWADFGTPILVGDRIITTQTTMLHPAEIVSVSLANGTWTQLSHENDEIFAKLETPTVEERWIPTTDGKKMLTWVVYPPKFDASKPRHPDVPRRPAGRHHPGVVNPLELPPDGLAGLHHGAAEPPRHDGFRPGMVRADLRRLHRPEHEGLLRGGRRPEGGALCGQDGGRGRQLRRLLRVLPGGHPPGPLLGLHRPRRHLQPGIDVYVDRRTVVPRLGQRRLQDPRRLYVRIPVEQDPGIRPSLRQLAA